MRRRRWTREGDFWRGAGPRITARGLVRDTVGWLRALRPFILGAIALSIWPAMDPALVEPVGLLATAPELVSETFTRCGRGRGHACVIDGDTIKLGQRKIRIIGIDAPEVSAPQCPAEAAKGEQATAKLQELLNQGPFEMTGRFDDRKDRYGRDLRALNRTNADGTTTSIAEEMRRSGLAHRYVSMKSSWC
jgi:micrococcal nuclease